MSEFSQIFLVFPLILYLIISPSISIQNDEISRKNKAFIALCLIHRLRICRVLNVAISNDGSHSFLLKRTLGTGSRFSFPIQFALTNFVFAFVCYSRSFILVKRRRRCKCLESFVFYYCNDTL